MTHRQPKKHRSNANSHSLYGVLKCLQFNFFTIVYTTIKAAPSLSRVQALARVASWFQLAVYSRKDQSTEEITNKRDKNLCQLASSKRKKSTTGTIEELHQDEHRDSQEQ